MGQGRQEEKGGKQKKKVKEDLEETTGPREKEGIVMVTIGRGGRAKGLAVL